LRRGNQAQLLQAWLERTSGRRWQTRHLDSLLDRLAKATGPGRADLGQGWLVRWQGTTLWICRGAASGAP
jgi:hypothetical protein